MKIKQIISLFGACFMLVACDQNPNQPDSALKASASNFPSQAEFDNEITQIPGTDHFVYRGSEPLNGQVQVDAYYGGLAGFLCRFQERIGAQNLFLNRLQ